MQLSYRGSSYAVQNPEVEVIETDQLGMFLGNRFKIKQTNVIQRHQTATHLKYRGVDYQK